MHIFGSLAVPFDGEAVPFLLDNVQLPERPHHC